MKYKHKEAKPNPVKNAKPYRKLKARQQREKYGCEWCADFKKCRRNVNSQCKYASVLDSVKTYMDYDRAAEKDLSKLVANFPDNI